MSNQLNLYNREINIVQDYIDRHLDQALTLEQLSETVNLSPFYFHRLFRHVTGEPLYAYIKRNRLEKAAFLLANTDRGISDIALDIGFSTPSAFAKAFKMTYGVSASSFRQGAFEYNTSRPVLADEPMVIPHHIRIHLFQSKQMYYVRHIGPYKGDVALFDNLFKKLIRWVRKSQLDVDMNALYTFYHDQGAHTPDDKLRLTLAVSGKLQPHHHEQLGTMRFSGGKYAVGRFVINHQQFSAAWSYMLFRWLPMSGYTFGEGYPFEFYTNQVATDSGKIMVEICIPVK